MKNFVNILIILFVTLSVFFVREDILNLIQKFSFRRSAPISEIKIPALKVPGEFLPQTASIEKEPKKEISAPGPLRVKKEFLQLGEEEILTAKEIIQLTNLHREQENLPSLIENDELNKSAQIKLDTVFKEQYFEHVSKKGLNISDLSREVGYNYLIIGENLAMGNFKNNQNLIDAWMTSLGHRANILNNRYKETGVAVHKGMFEGLELWLAVTHFGLPKSSCSSIDENLRAVIEKNELNLNSMSVEIEAKKKETEELESFFDSEKIENFNKLVKEYNDFLASIKNQIDEYNSQVNLFNQCLEGN